MIKNLSFSIMTFLSLGSIANFNAQCNAIDSFSENFDTLSCCAFGVVPNCWNSLRTSTGNQIISHTTPASGGSNVYQTGYGSGAVSIVIMPVLSNINAGTHHFKFKVRVNSGPGKLDFGYVTDANDINSFVTLESLTITNSTYNSSAERTLDVPTTVPASARLAIRNPGATWAGHYWDDAVWEPKSNLNVQDADLTSFKVYPNPASDNIEISEAQRVSDITIFDASGRLLKTVTAPQSKISLSELSAGIYYLKIKFKDKSTTVLSEKFIKK
ncbi:hypothetical protein ASG21_10545 [Chryseobacterium sp. Leaf394]|nr:hypothetical protein ASG21_10545 [Chryseobacterium sp. Leaf394]